MSVNIIADGLTQDEAYNLEREIIEDYVFNKGYGIDIVGYNNKRDESGHLTNQTFGGDGSYGMKHTDEWCIQHSEDMSGENNPMYGINVWDLYSEEKASEVREKLSQSSKGENNPMYGISPQERMDDETYKGWLKKQQNRNRNGSNNPNWHNDTLKKKYQENPELTKLLARPGTQNGRAIHIFVYDLDMNYIKEFGFIGECCEWLNSFEKTKKKINSMRPRISRVLDTGESYKNYLYFTTKQ